MFKKIRQKIKEDSEYRFGKYGTFMYRFAISHWHWGVSLCKFEENWSLHLFCLWITLWKTRIEPLEIMDWWGIAYYPDEAYLALGWGEKRWTINMPWSYGHCRWYQGRRDGTFDLVKNSYSFWNPIPDEYFRETYDYTYTLESGVVQERKATVQVVKMTWCWSGIPFRWLYWPCKTSTFIDVNFDHEVGERSGSWKGGTIGCGWDLLPAETPEQSLRRMEKERKF
jgi:hypothetical protein